MNSVNNSLFHPMQGAILPSFEIQTIDDGKPISPHLLEALADPFEKIHCLKVEDSFLRFVQSPELSIEIESQRNAFRKHMVAKIADRFRLEPAGQNLRPQNEGLVLQFKKTHDTIIPMRLLMTYVENEKDQLQQEQLYEQPVVQRPTPKVMQRNPNKSGVSKQDDTKKKVISEEDQEKQYEEARARIFGLATTASSSSEELNNLGLAPPSREATPTAKSPSVDENLLKLASLEMSDIQKPAEQQASVARRNRDVMNKARMKDERGDRSDPDFARHRRSHAAPMAPPMGMPYGMYPPPYGYPIPYPNAGYPPMAPMDMSGGGYPQMQYPGYPIDPAYLNWQQPQLPAGYIPGPVPQQYQQMQHRGKSHSNGTHKSNGGGRGSSSNVGGKGSNPAEFPPLGPG